MNLDAEFAAARARIFAAIETRYALAVRSTAKLGSFHRMALGQRYGKRGKLNREQK